MTDDELVERMTELRLRFASQDEIAHELQVSKYRIEKLWVRMPREIQGQLMRRDGRAWFLESKRGGVRPRVPEKNLVLDPRRCPSCGFFFSADNRRQATGRCLLCDLQRAGRVVTYADLMGA